MTDIYEKFENEKEEIIEKVGNRIVKEALELIEVHKDSNIAAFNLFSKCCRESLLKMLDKIEKGEKFLMGEFCQTIVMYEHDEVEARLMSEMQVNIIEREVSRNPKKIGYVDDPSEATQLIAVRADASTINYILHPTEAVQMEAVKANPSLVIDIENPTDAVKIEAIKADPELIEHIEKPTEQMLFWANMLK